MKVNIGCGRQPLEGYVNCDIYGGTADVVFDCQDPWPFEENSVTEVRSMHVLEHLPRPLDFFKEAWRVLVPNGAVILQLPYGAHRSAWWDLTHLRPWYPENFAIVQPGYHEQTGNPQHEEWKTPYAVHFVTVRVGRNVYTKFKKPVIGRIFKHLWPYLTDVGEELFVQLFALKRDEDVNTFRLRQQPNAVPIQWAVFQHHADGRRTLNPGELPVLIPILGQIGYAIYHGEAEDD